jgi:hypothetical protein
LELMKWYSNLIKFCPGRYLPLVPVWDFSANDMRKTQTEKSA